MTLRFAELTGDRSPLHVDRQYAQRAAYGRPVVHGMRVVHEMLAVLAAHVCSRHHQTAQQSRHDLLQPTTPPGAPTPGNSSEDAGKRHVSAPGRPVMTATGAITVEFRNPVFPGDRLRISWSRTGSATAAGGPSAPATGATATPNVHTHGREAVQNMGQASGASELLDQSDNNSLGQASNRTCPIHDDLSAYTLRGVAETERGIAAVVELSVPYDTELARRAASAREALRPVYVTLAEPAADPQGAEQSATFNDGAPSVHPPEEVNRLDIDDILLDEPVRGTYTYPGTSAADLRPELLTLLRLLGLCSYLVGMKLPGQQALFVKAQLEWHALQHNPLEVPLHYELTPTHVDRKLRLVDCALLVRTADGEQVATGRLRSYVRFTPAVPNVAAVVGYARDLSNALSGKVALVCGASRGLGAEITATLALAGATVYGTYRSSSEDAKSLASAITQRGGRVELLQGDVGDSRWLNDVVEGIVHKHGRLDLLVLNACGQPKIGATGDAFHDYLTRNLQLVSVPLETALPALRHSRGAVCLVSSSFVAQAPRGLEAYVALKKTAEELIRAQASAAPEVFFQIARPPKLQTRWNDSPAGVVGAIPSWCAAVAIVQGLAAQADHREAPRDNVLVLEQFPLLEPRDEAGSRRTVSLAIAATFTAEPLGEELKRWARRLAWQLDARFAGYNQVVQELISPVGLFAANRDGLNVALVRVRDWLRELSEEVGSDAQRLQAHLDDVGNQIVQALEQYAAAGRAPLLLIVAPSDLPKATPADEPIARWERELIACAEKLRAVHVLDARQWHSVYGLDTADAAAYYDRNRDRIGHIPFTPSYYAFLATLIVRRAYRLLTPPRKTIVVDCDNTLWDGVVGEVGPQGVRFDEHHLALQRKLARLAESGVLVCLCSKNQEDDVWAVFAQRANEMPLRREHIVAAAINWMPKSQNITELARSLNLGRDSFAFLDDNPVECAEVRANCPDVLTVQWPREPEQALKLLNHFWELDPLAATAEDRKRTEMYRQEFQRQQLKAQAKDFADFLRSLELKLDFRPLNREDLPRASQLTLRTNQFNFTTIRRSEAELWELVAEHGYRCWTVRVSDRFGDYGIVGLVVTKPISDASDQRVLEVDTFLLSCRVLGRGVEHKIVAFLAEQALALGAEYLRFHIRYTKKNVPARRFLQSIVPAECLETGDDHMSCILEARRYVDLSYDPERHACESETADARSGTDNRGSGEDGGAEDVVTWTRERERQILRTAFEWADLGRANSSGQTAVAQQQHEPAPAGAATTGEVRHVVLDAFARQLGMPAEQVARVDRLDQLGCDSFKIVEITVALLERYPQLPATLLFEHQTVSEIVRAIESHSAGSSSRQPSAPLAAARPRARTVSDIAVVGLALRCAGANSTEELWQLLRRKGSAVREVPTDRRHFLGVLRDSRKHWAGLLDDPDRFDATFFGIAPREAVMLDPQLRLLLEVSWEALEQAGWTDGTEIANTGVFVGVMYGDYVFAANQWAESQAYPYRCWEGFSIANRLSQILGFHGPSVAVDTACSSSGTALYMACRALRAGDCKAAVVGGVNLILDPNRFSQLGRLGILSPDGRCRPFGEEANGTVLGEGAVALVLMPVDEAVKQGCTILGVIKGVGISHGTGTVGFTAPNPTAQAIAIREAIRAAGIDPRTISFVETHGTGTALGDPIETRGLQLAYEDRSLWCDEELADAAPLRLGAIKPNVGHLEAGAALIGVAKVLLQFQHQELAPTITSERPNPQVPWDRTRFVVQRDRAPWERPRLRCKDGTVREFPRRAGVSSFGVGGANVHVVLEEPPSVALEQPTHDEPDRTWHVLALSARSPEALRAYAGKVAEFLRRTTDDQMANVCYSLAVGRRAFEYRLALPCRSADDARRTLAAFAESGELRAGHTGRTAGQRPRVAFLFTGQGAQYVSMGKGLYRSNPVFRRALDRYFALVNEHLDRPLQEVVFGEDDELLKQTRYTQPALFCVQLALADLWRGWGVVPDIVCGHSVGEIAAMVVAGGLSPADGARLAAIRGRLMGELPAGGTMAVVAAPEAVVRGVLASGTCIAAVNGPRQTVIAGPVEAVDQTVRQLEASGHKVTRLPVSHAFHSSLMKPILGPFREAIRDIRFHAPKLTFVSTVTGAVASEELTDAQYWVDQIRRPVRYADAARTILEMADVCLEIGPHPVLVGLAQTLPEASGKTFASSLRRQRDDEAVVADAVAALFAAGMPIDWRGWDEGRARQRVQVPSYPFQRKRYWIGAVPTVSCSAAEESTEQTIELETYRLDWIQKQLDPGQNPAQVLVVGTGQEATKALAAFDSAGIPCAHASSLREADGSEAERCLVLDFRALDSDLSPQSFPQFLARLATELCDLQRRWKGRNHSYWLLTKNAVCVGSERLDPCHSALWGFMRSAMLELHDVALGVADVCADGWTEVATALASAGDEDQLAFRNGDVYAVRLRRFELPDNAQQPDVDPNAIYLITGGTGWLGGAIAIELARLGARKIWLVSRRGLVSEGVLEELRRLGVASEDVRVVRADVACPDAVRRLADEIRSAGARLGGIVHAAGVDRPTSLSRLQADDVAAVWAGKATGAWQIAELAREFRPDFVCFFSSLAAAVGAARRSHYAAANAFLDGLACQLHSEGIRATSLAWGPWVGGGMADAGTLKEFARIGNLAIGRDEGTGLFSKVIAQTTVPAHIVAARIDWARFAPAYELVRTRPIIELLRPGPVASGQRTAFDRSAVERIVREEFARALGYNNADAIRRDAELLALGLDSLLAVDILTRLRKRLPLPAGLSLFDYRTLHDVVDAIAAYAVCTEAAPAGAPPQSNAEVLDILRRAAAETLGLDVEAVATDRPLSALGMDSLMVADFLTRVRKATGRSLSSFALDRDTLSELAEQLSADGEKSRSTGRPATPSGRAVRYRPELEPAIYSFCREAWPDRAPELIPARWRWMFVQSAQRLGIDPAVWLYVEDGRVLGHNGAIPVRLQVGDREVTTAWFVDTMVLEEARDRAVGSAVMLASVADWPFSLSLGQTPYMREILRRLGWKDVCPLNTYVYVLRPMALGRAKVTTPIVGTLAGAALALKQWWHGHPVANGHSRAFRVEEVASYGPEQDELWQRVRAHFPVAVVRDRSFMQWKYVEQPGQEFIRLHLWDGARLAGTAVLLVRRPDRVYRYRRAFLVDLLVDPDDEVAVGALLSAVIARARQTGSALLTCYLTCPRLETCLVRAGFWRREPQRYLLVRPDRAEVDVRLLLDGRQWLLTMGDSDIDRPSWTDEELDPSTARSTAVGL